MNIEERLSSSQGHRDQGPNKILAEEIVRNRDSELLSRLVDFLKSRPKTALANDAILAIKAVSDEAPEMLLDQVDFLVSFLGAKVNRQVFAAMIALGNLSKVDAEKMLPHLPSILDAMEKGTVVTKDHGFNILVQLYKTDRNRTDVTPLLMEWLWGGPDNQFGQYLEKFMAVMIPEHVSELEELVEGRMRDLVNENHQKRAMKNLKKIRKMPSK